MEDKRSYIDRTKAFAELAQRVARGEVLVPPQHLPPQERRLHMRMTLREDHHFRLRDEPEELQLKFDKMATSPFVFFRGTALLFYRDLAGVDVHLPWVVCNGDVHPENFGVMPSADGQPFFGLNDFDEAAFAPFTWDLRRGAVSFHLAAGENNFSAKKQRRVAEQFVRGYVEGLVDYAKDESELTHQYRADNSPPIIRDLIGAASKKTRRKLLSKWVDLEKGRFKPSDELVPMTEDVERFQKDLTEYIHRDVERPGRSEEHFEIKDVARKKGSGTASLGFPRYYVLIEGESSGAHHDDILLEVKMSRESVLTGLVPTSEETRRLDPALRIVESHRVHLVGGDPYYGYATIDGRSFLVRERSPFKKSVKLEKLGAKEFKEYANVCGRVLAQAHARSDVDTGIGHGSAEDAILEAIDQDLFVADLVRFAEAGAAQVRADHAHYVEDYEIGAFRYLD